MYAVALSAKSSGSTRCVYEQKDNSDIHGKFGINDSKKIEGRILSNDKSAYWDTVNKLARFPKLETCTASFSGFIDPNAAIGTR